MVAYGKSIESMMAHRRGATAAMAMLTVGAGAYGFVKGISDRGVSANLMDLTTGDPNMEQYALGTNNGMRSLLMPLPGSAINNLSETSLVAGTAGGTIGGGLLGAGAGAALGRKHGLKTMIMSGLAGGVIGTGVGGRIGYRATSQGYINSTTFSDSLRGRRYDNRMPVVDGSLVFGAYNSRMGGY